MNNAVANSNLKKGIWLYFLLLIFEGALRKWFLPGLSTALLIVRDPVAAWIIFMALKRGLLNFNFFAFAMILVCAVSFFTTLLLGHGNLPVAVFGARIFILQFPLLFVIGRIFDREDVLKIGKFLLYLLPFMTILIAMQFYSPQSAWVNRGVGGDTEGAGFSGALGYFRPPGTFSFTNGLAQFYGFVAPFIFYFWLKRSNINKLLLIIATVALLAAIPLSISRTMLFSIAVVLLFTMIASLYQPRYLRGMIMTGICGMIALAFLSMTPFFQTATEAFTERFTSANETEGGLEGVLGDRYLGGMLGALAYNPVSNSFFGQGLGMGTNVGAMLMKGRMAFLISEGEWGRLIGEMGPLLGVLTILIRLALSATLTLKAFRRLSSGDILPWLLVSFALLNIPQGQWSQPTNLGFTVLSAGLVLASMNTGRQISGTPKP
ncbi:hypothetical protein HRG84_01315 [Flavisolibacter sp. BT320]|nr:hypothetical protein [Flavisolibacter longurius]